MLQPIQRYGRGGTMKGTSKGRCSVTKSACDVSYHVNTQALALVCNLSYFSKGSSMKTLSLKTHSVVDIYTLQDGLD